MLACVRVGSERMWGHPSPPGGPRHSGLTVADSEASHV